MRKDRKEFSCERPPRQAGIYKITLHVIVGTYEHLDEFIYYGPNHKKAEAHAKYLLKDYWGEGETHFNSVDGGYYNSGVTQVVFLEKIEWFDSLTIYVEDHGNRLLRFFKYDDDTFEDGWTTVIENQSRPKWVVEQDHFPDGTDRPTGGWNPDNATF